MKIAVFGAGGQLGRALLRVGGRLGIEIAGFDRQAADITDAIAVGTVLAKVQAHLIINAAAYTAVDKAESDSERAFAINRDGAANLARAGLPLIHISTDYVFDGAKSGPYVETDPVAPLGVYGRSKAEGEAAAAGAVILRTAWVYGLEGSNFVKTMLRLGAERDVVRVVDDQRGSPTFADDLAEAILAIAARPVPGIYHLAGAGEASWFEVAQAIFTGRPGPRLEAITTGDYPTAAARPANSVLDCSKAKAIFGVELPHWKDGLNRMLQRNP